MNFQIGDITDRALTTTLLHELECCKESFDNFLRFTQLNLMGVCDKNTKIHCYNSYTDFLHHLYEFYVVVFKRNQKKTDGIKYNVLDDMFNNEGQGS